MLNLATKTKSWASIIMIPAMHVTVHRAAGCSILRSHQKTDASKIGMGGTGLVPIPTSVKWEQGSPFLRINKNIVEMGNQSRSRYAFFGTCYTRENWAVSDLNARPSVCETDFSLFDNS